MPPDVLVSVPGSSAAPLTYQVAQQQEILLKAAAASFDGSAAGSAWLPCLRIIAPGGQVVGQYITGSSVAAGSSADVSFFPNAQTAAASTGGSLDIEHNAASVGTEPALDFEDSGSLTWTVTDVAGTRVTVSGTVAGATDQPFAIAYRSGFNIPTAAGGASANFDPWDFIDASGADIDLDGSGRVRINTAGLYRINFGLQVFDSTWLTTDTLALNCIMITGGLGNQLSSTNLGLNQQVGSDGTVAGVHSWEASEEIWANIQTVPETLRMQTILVTGGALHTATNTFAVANILRVRDFSAGGVS